MAGTPSPNARRRYVTLADAAAYVGCNERTIRRAIAAGEITGYRIGARLVRVDLDQLDAEMVGRVPTTDGSGAVAAER
jgi:excisionase family DNA binding protein